MANVNVLFQPQSFLVTEGTSVTFSTSGSLLGTSLSGKTVIYQWLSSGNSGSTFGNIAGATNNAYTVTALRVFDSYFYKASLSASGVEAAVFTNNATLAIRLTGDPHASFKVGLESSTNRFRRLVTLGLV